MRVAAVLTTLFATLALAGCGGEKEQKTGGETGRGTITCNGTRKASATFPAPAAVVFTKSAQRGPTAIYDGFARGSLEMVYSEYKDTLDNGGYDVKDSEKEEDDAEIEYEGHGTEGQVALRAACPNGRISVHVTNRPS